MTARINKSVRSLETTMAAFQKIFACPRLALCGGAIAAVLLAGGCSNQPEVKQEICPTISTLPNTERKVAFAETGRDLTDVVYEVQIVDGIINCELDDNVVYAEFKVQFLASRGPANQSRRASFEYVVAMLDPDGVVISREEFGLTVPFETSQGRVAVTDTLNPKIPLNEGESPRQYTLYVGLKVTEEELEYNRNNRR
jgi:hypothetical protein